MKRVIFTEGHIVGCRPRDGFYTEGHVVACRSRDGFYGRAAGGLVEGEVDAGR